MELFTARLEVLHATDMVLPRGWRGAGVVTVHDLAFLEHPEFLTDEARRYYGGVLPSVRRARRIITVSQHTRDQVLRHTDVDPGRVRVVHNAVPSDFGASFPGDALERLGLAGRAYVLFVGTIEPRKNLTTLLEAFEVLLTSAPDLRLVLAGADGWLSAPVRARAATSPAAGAIDILGPVSPADLPGLYRGAAVLAHPAWDEGFGMTVVEAMACGTPVVAARAGSLPEIAGDAAVLVPPDDPRAWAAALADVVADPAHGADLARRGRARARAFTVEKMATATLEVYREAAA